jgi:hypothetical protein
MRGFCVITWWWIERMVCVSTRTHATCNTTDPLSVWPLQVATACSSFHL